MSLSTRTQLALSVVALAALGWVGVTSYNFLMTDQILASKNQKIIEITDSYQNLQQNFETLQTDINETTKQIAQRQAYLEQLMSSESVQEDEDEMESVPDELSPSDSEQPSQDLQSSSRSKSRLISKLFTNANAYGGHFNSFKLLQQTSDQLAYLASEQNKQARKLIHKIAIRLDNIEKTLQSAGLKSDLVLELLEDDMSSYMGQGGPMFPVADPDNDEDMAKQTIAAKTFNQLVSNHSRLEDLQLALLSMPVRMPVLDNYYISSHFGIRKDPVTKKRARHHGIDLAGWWKTPIVAPAPGIVTKAGVNGAYGNFIEIDHGNGFKTRYGHLGKINVRKGDHVEVSQTIGLMGSTGRSTGPHLHYEIWFGGKPRNPMKFFKAAEHVLKIQQQQIAG